MMNNDDFITTIVDALDKRIEARIKPLQADLSTIKGDVATLKGEVATLHDGQAHTNTALEALAAGQKELATKQEVEEAVEAAKVELKADIYTLHAKLVKKVQSHERRLDDAGIPNPDKN